MATTNERIKAVMLRAGIDTPELKPKPRANPKPENTVAVDSNEAGRYLQKLMNGVTFDIAMTGEGSRNETLHGKAYKIGVYIGAGYNIDYELAAEGLKAAGLRSGLPDWEVEGAVERGLKAGVNSGEVPNNPPTGMVAAASSETTSAQHIDETTFWEDPNRPELATIRQYAQARIVSPWAVLGAVLVRVVCATEPNLVLPPTVGGEMSLNMFIALTGASGTGKDAAQAVAAEAVDFGLDALDPLTPGSGEGIAHAFAQRKGNETDLHTTRVLFAIAEIDTFAALSARRGATLTAVLRDCFGGAPLGFQYADASKRLAIKAHEYRMGLLAGVQPGRAGALLDDADGGTPQRFLWMPTIDPLAPENPPPTPQAHPWTHVGPIELDKTIGHNINGRYEMPICDTAREAIIENRQRVIRGDKTDALDGHLLLTQLKAAASLALLNGHLEVTEDDWRVSGTVLAVSNRTRNSVVEYRKAEARKSNDKIGEKQAYRELAAEQAREEAKQQAIERVAKLLPDKLPDDGEWATRRALVGKIHSRDRKYVDDALAMLVEEGHLEVEETSRTVRYKLAM